MLIEFFFDKIAIFLNSTSVINILFLITLIINGIVFIVVLYHWFTYRPSTAVVLVQNEQILRVYRKHWFRFFTDVLIIVALIFIPLTLSLLPSDQMQWFKSITPFLNALYSSWLVFLLFGFLIMATNYFLDIWVLTNKRLVDVDQRGLFKRDISEIRLEKIEDINIKIFGIIDTFLGIGTVEIESAGAVKEFSLKNIAHPEQARAEISATASRKLDEVQEVKIVV